MHKALRFALLLAPLVLGPACERETGGGTPANAELTDRDCGQRRALLTSYVEAFRAIAESGSGDPTPVHEAMAELSERTDALRNPGEFVRRYRRLLHLTDLLGRLPKDDKERASFEGEFLAFVREVRPDAKAETLDPAVVMGAMSDEIVLLYMWVDGVNDRAAIVSKYNVGE